MSIFLKLNLEAEPRRSSLLTQVQEGRDSILSLLFSEKRSRKKRTHTEPNTPKSDNTPTADLFDKSKKDPEKDKFLEIFEKQEKDRADGRAINRKIGKNAFFQEKKELFEEKLDVEGLIHLCRSLTLETFKESEIVYQKGDKTNDKIYLIYKGEVEVLQVGEDGGLKVECKQSNFSMMNISVNDGNSQQKPRRSLFRQLNLESEMMYDRSTGRKSLDVKGLVAANPHLKTFVSKTMTSGEYLGKEVLEKRGEWEDTMVAKTETHLLVLNVKDLEHVKCRYEKEMIQRLNLIWKHLSVPTQNEGEIKNKFFECVNEKVLPFGENLLCEGDIDKYFYFLIDGKCEIQKKLKEKADSHHENSSPKTKAHKNISICLVESGTFLGEELLFNKNACHEYTVKVTSAKAVLFQFSVVDFKSTFNKEILDNIRESYQEKTKSHQDIYHNICKELNKRNSKTLTTLSLVSKSPTHQGSSNLGFGSRWDVMSGANSQEAENEASSTTKRNDGSTSRRFFTHVVATATDRTPLGLAGDRRNSDITKIKGQIMSFHHNVVVVKSDRIATEEVSPKGKYWNDNGHRFAEYEEYAYANAKDYDSLDQVVHTVGNKGRPGMDEYLNSIEDFENFSKELHRNKRDSKLMHPIENFKLNFKNPDEEKKANNTRNSRLSFIESPLFHKDSKEKDIIILNPGKMVSQEFQARSPVRKVSKSVKPSNSKIDLKALRNQFYDSPQVSIRDYLALYKKAHIHNKFARNNTENLKIKSGDYASLMKSKHLPSIHREDYSPKMDNLAEMKTIRVSMSKSPRVGKVTPLTRRPEHVVLEPINQKTPQVKTSLVKIRMTDRDL